VVVFVEVNRIGDPDGLHQLLSEMEAVRLLQVTNVGTNAIILPLYGVLVHASHVEFLELGHEGRGGL
jgi:hypothetical protein